MRAKLSFVVKFKEMVLCEEKKKKKRELKSCTEKQNRRGFLFFFG
jgi:hypothetical protein